MAFETGQAGRRHIVRERVSTTTAGPGSDDPEHDESTPAETKIVTPVLPSRTILRL